MGNGLQDSINELLALHGMGRFADMERRARIFLKSFSGNPVLCELLGLALASQQRHAEALPFLQRAVRAQSNEPQFWDNLALCHFQLGQLADAEASLRRSLALNPGSAGTLTALGGVLGALHRYGEARSILERALAIEPGNPAIHFELGRTLARQNEPVPAEQHLRFALAANPEVAATHYELGLLSRKSGKLGAAEASFRRAIELDRIHPAAYAQLAVVLSLANRRQEAVAAAHAALNAVGEIESGASESDLDVLDLAADVLEDAGRSGDVTGIFKATRKFRMDPLRALRAVHAARRVCDWDFAASLEHEARRVAEPQSPINGAAPLLLLSLPQATPAEQLATAQKYARLVMTAASPSVRPPAVRRDGRIRLRVGYFSGDFCDHATAHLIAGVIEAQDRERFEVVGYDFSPPAVDEYRRRLEHAFDRIVEIRDWPQPEATRRIAEDEVDILVDLKGWTKGSLAAVLAPRPASLQVQWLGYPGTLGAPWIDYIIADTVLIPPGHEAHFSEKIIRLPDTYQPNDDKRPVGPTLDRQFYGLADDAFVFGSFNDMFKLTPEIFELWLGLLQAADRSVLWLLQPEPAAAEALRARAARRGISPERIIFAPLVAPPEHRARLARADLALDCFPYGSHTTASDMLWAGVPLVALMGETFASRVSASLLTAAGLPELITTSYDDYYRLALRLATDRAELARLKSRLKDRRRTAALFDTKRFTRNLEAAFLAIWERHRSGLPPDHVTIAPERSD